MRRFFGVSLAAGETVELASCALVGVTLAAPTTGCVVFANEWVLCRLSPRRLQWSQKRGLPMDTVRLRCEGPSGALVHVLARVKPSSSNRRSAPALAQPRAAEVRELPGRGRSLVARSAPMSEQPDRRPRTARIRRGETIHTEAPQVFVRTSGGGRSGTLACARCLAFLGGAELHLQLNAGVLDLDGAVDALGAAAPPGSSPVIRCGCGALYCSEACRTADIDRGHALLFPCGGAAGAEGAAQYGALASRGGGSAPSKKRRIRTTDTDARQSRDDQQQRRHAALDAWRRHAADVGLPEVELAGTLLAARLWHTAPPSDEGARALVALNHTQVRLHGSHPCTLLPTALCARFSLTVAAQRALPAALCARFSLTVDVLSVCCRSLCELCSSGTLPVRRREWLHMTT
jgi:hypothetical protein